VMYSNNLNTSVYNTVHTRLTVCCHCIFDHLTVTNLYNAVCVFIDDTA